MTRDTRTRLKLTRQGGPVVSYRCPTNKVGYATKDDAWTAAERQMDLGKVDPGCHIQHWQCRDCQSWHIGNRRIVRR